VHGVVSVGPTFALDLEPWGKEIDRVGKDSPAFFSGIALVWRMSIEHLKWDGRRKRILVLGAEFRFCFIALFTTLHCTLHGRGGGGRQLCSVAIQKTAFLFLWRE
jgi:hypothetical protein